MNDKQDIIFETERLYLREMTIADAEHAYSLNLDPEVLKYTGDASFKNVEEAAKFLEAYSHFKTYGFGRWAVIRKEDNEFLGWCGLKYHPENNEVDVGFRFHKKYWNQGYATEAGAACVDFGFKRFGFESIIGNVMKGNIASTKVLEKIGLNFESEISEASGCDLLYRIYSPISGF